MRKWGILSLLVLSYGLRAVTQNLILNPSFEEYNLCPDNFNQIENARYWYNAGGTPDLLHECGFYEMISFGTVGDYTQPPFEGEGVGGLGVSFPFRLRSDTIFRGYMTGTLVEALKSNTYYLKVHVLSYPTNRTRQLDVYFTEDRIPPFNGYARDANPQMSFDGWIGSYPEWKLHEGCVEAIEGAQYFTIGNFQTPFTDSVEFSDVSFNSIIHLDAFGLFEIPIFERKDTAIISGDCMELTSEINSIPVYHLVQGDTITNAYCFDSTGTFQIKTMVRACDKLIQEYNVEVKRCDVDLVCSNISLKRNNEIQFKCSVNDEDDIELLTFSLYDRWGNQWAHFNDLNSNRLTIPHIGTGVYVYRLEYQVCGIKKWKTGDITIVE